MYRSLLAILFIGCFSVLQAQTSTNNPYSSIGIGDISQYGNAYTSAMGGSYAALMDSSQTNLYNPSSYSLVAQQLPLFSFGVTHVEKTFSNGNQESDGRFTGITHMSLVIPFAKRFGLAFGLKPLSRKGYEINNAEVVGGDSIHYLYKGDGAIQEFLLGFSATLIKRRNQSLTLGVNGKHYFGRVNDERRTYKNTNSGESGGQDIRSLRAKALGIEAGFNYDYHLSNSQSFRLGGTFRPSSSLNFYQSNTRIYYSSYANQNSYDTLLNQMPRKGDVYLPSKTSIGLTYSFTPANDSTRGRSKLPKLLVTASYTIEDYSNYTETFDTDVNKNQFVNSNAIRLGIEYSPHRIAVDRSAYLNFFDKFKYRVGAYTVNTPYEVKGKQLVNRGVTAGIGIPINLKGAVSTVNISGNYGKMGAGSGSGILQETYYGFSFGINIAPGYDRWFKKYKLD